MSLTGLDRFAGFDLVSFHQCLTSQLVLENLKKEGPQHPQSKLRRAYPYTLKRNLSLMLIFLKQQRPQHPQSKPRRAYLYAPLSMSPKRNLSLMMTMTTTIRCPVLLLL